MNAPLVLSTAMSVYSVLLYSVDRLLSSAGKLESVCLVYILSASPEGEDDGDDEGLLEGELDGLLEGDELGELDGELLGLLLGLLDGELDGLLDGEEDGLLLGELDGELDGDEEGELDGEEPPPPGVSGVPALAKVEGLFWLLYSVEIHSAERTPA